MLNLSEPSSPHPLVPCVSGQVVVKTKADYDAESKKGKLRSPKIAEFSISIIEGVSERLKVRIICVICAPLASPLPPSYTPSLHTCVQGERVRE